MGERCVGEEASPDDLEALCALLRRCLSEGGMGFSSSWAPTHNDGNGQPVPSRSATREELLALAAVLKEAPGTVLEFIPGIGAFGDEQRDLMAELSLAADRPLNWNLHVPNSASPDLSQAQLAASDHADARGATVRALSLPQPMTVRLNFVSGFVLDALPGWASLFEQPVDERKRSLSDPTQRKQLDEGATSDAAGPLRALAAWEKMTVDQVSNPELASLRGREIGEIAAAEGKSPFDCMLDIAVADDLQTSFMPPSFGTDDATWSLRAEAWRDPRTVVGGSDAGAHLDMIDTFAFSTQLLQNARDRGLLPLEEAVRQLTDVPARLYGLKDRGRIAPGCHADLVVFDADAVGSGPTYVRDDLPGGGGRLFADARGIDHVFVSGVEIVRAGEATEARPGEGPSPGLRHADRARRRGRGGRVSPASAESQPDEGFDPIAAEVIRGAMETVAYEMATHVSLTAKTPIINQSNERNATVLDGRGRLAALSVGVPQFMLSSRGPIRFALDFFAEEGGLRDGDVLVGNDPYHGGGHLPDYNVFSPLVVDGEVVLIASIQCHHADTGGGVPGGYNAEALDLWAEGVRFPAVKVIEEGRERKDLVYMMKVNTRTPTFLGDLRAQIGAAQLGVRRLRELVDRYGVSAVRDGVEHAIQHTRRRFRREVASWPDGTYVADAYVDHDPVGNRDIRVHVEVTVAGEELRVDFTGSDTRPELKAWSAFGNTQGYVVAQLAAMMDPSHSQERGLLRLDRDRGTQGQLREPARKRHGRGGDPPPGGRGRGGAVSCTGADPPGARLPPGLQDRDALRAGRHPPGIRRALLRPRRRLPGGLLQRREGCRRLGLLPGLLRQRDPRHQRDQRVDPALPQREPRVPHRQRRRRALAGRARLPRGQAHAGTHHPVDLDGRHAPPAARLREGPGRQPEPSHRARRNPPRRGGLAHGQRGRARGG